MKAKHILTVILLLLSLAACAQEDAPEPDTTPTLPTIAQSKTPLELLTEASEKTKNAASFTVRYGKVSVSGGENNEDTFTYHVSADQPFDTHSLYADVPDFPTNEALLSDFCTLPLRAIPSNDGTIRYELPELTVEALWKLMYGQSASAPEYSQSAQVICSAALVVGADGCLTEVEFSVERYASADQLDQAATFFLSISEIVS